MNNAAIIGPRGSLTGDDAVDDWAAELRTLIETNVVSAMGCIKEAVADMSTARGGGGGSIVSVSSGSAMIGSPLLHLEAASRHAHQRESQNDASRHHCSGAR